MNALTVHVVGAPVQQGSKTAGVTKDGKPYLRDSNDKQLRPWRKDVVDRVLDAMTATGWATLDAPVEVAITFHLPRPAAHYGTGRNAGVLKDTAPRWKPTMPDIDKLTRAVLDALTTSQAIRDDARVARLVVEKRYADAATGARIVITPLISSPADAGSPARAAGEGSTQEALPL
jgi:Holliday junction resolvase RusA-like endonuclease